MIRVTRLIQVLLPRTELGCRSPHLEGRTLADRGVARDLAMHDQRGKSKSTDDKPG